MYVVASSLKLIEVETFSTDATFKFFKIKILRHRK